MHTGDPRALSTGQLLAEHERLFGPLDPAGRRRLLAMARRLGRRHRPLPSVLAA